MQLLQYPNESIIDNLNSIRLEASRHFGKLKKEYLSLKKMNFRQTVKTRISEICMGKSMALRRVTSLKLI